MTKIIHAFIKPLVALGLASGMLSQTASAQLPTGDLEDMHKVEDYLNGLTTLRARFVQVGADGGYAEGLFWLSRPGLARFEYAPPVDLLLVSDGDWMIFFDAEVDQVSHIPIDEGPMRFLLMDTISLFDEVNVVDIRRDSNILRVGVVDRENPGEGTVTLMFEENPLELRQWEVIDPQGNQVTVTLLEVEKGMDLSRDLFYFTANDRRDPNFRKGRYD